MVHDEMTTVPPSIAIPPPYKHKNKTCENPIGAMWGSYRSLRHVPAVVDEYVGSSCSSKTRGKHVSHFPTGAMGTFEVSGADGTYHNLVD